MIKTLQLTTLFSALLIFSPAQAELEKKIDDLCGKAKACALEEMGDVPPEVKEMMAGMVEGLCKPLIAPYQKTIGDAGLEKKAEACIDSIVSMSCAEMMANKGDKQTEECNDFERAADEAGVDLKSQ